MSATALSRRQLLEGAGVLTIGFSLTGIGDAQAAMASIDQAPRPVEPEKLDSWLAIERNGTVTLFTGRVDLGTGTETVFAQFVSEELDVALDKIRVVMGDTRLTPDQGKTTASLNVVRGSQPVRMAAAQARAVLGG